MKDYTYHDSVPFPSIGVACQNSQATLLPLNHILAHSPARNRDRFAGPPRMILEREHGRKPNIDQPEMKSPYRKEDKWKGIEHEFGKIKVHVVPTVTDASWRPLTMRSTP